MKTWKLNPSHGSVPLDFVTGVMSGIGSAELAQCFLEAMQCVLPASHCTVFALEGDGRVSAVSTASAHGAIASVTAVEYFRYGFDQLDANMVWLARKKTPVRSQTWMSHQRAEEVSNSHYRDVCYGQPGIRERTSVLLLNADGRRIAISFYRNLAFAPFDAGDFEAIGQCAPVLHEAVIAHIRKAPRGLAGDSLHQKVLSLLGKRERQVMTHVLAGHTTREIAGKLGLSSTTVLTYRYRAFAKLGVRTHRELLSMLDSLPANIAPRG